MSRLGVTLSIYIFLLLAMSGFRYLTRSVYPNLTDLQAQKEELVEKKSLIISQIEQLKSPSRIRAWALEKKMIPWTQAKKEFKQLEGN